ncbi:hypothetical protein GCM10023085_37990 [Actinomadura viridis]|uniref:Uncharacterized protein n=1 Tax=Actinomadura viridis TaxID=58110 RepID=A0A931GLP4_9ACTN|nr:hypothetical protein [Actinomadura viridis]MBG6087666.1 hypothetical protein [Actinomadura viridis]
MNSECAISVLQDLLRVYDHRFLDLDGPQRERLVEGTRRMLGDEDLSDAARAALPSAYRLRAFCIRHGLRDELERMIRDEVAGHRVGAVVVGGRVYAMYPYLRGVPRKDADITAEVGVEHRLDAVGWHGGRVRIRGRAVIERVEARRTQVEIVLRESGSGAEHRCAAGPLEDGFEAAGIAVPGPGLWEVHVAASTLGLTREARLGPVRGPRLKTEPQRRSLGAAGQGTILFTGGGHLAVRVERGDGDGGARAGRRWRPGARLRRLMPWRS